MKKRSTLVLVIALEIYVKARRELLLSMSNEIALFRGVTAAGWPPKRHPRWGAARALLLLEKHDIMYSS